MTCRTIRKLALESPNDPTTAHIIAEHLQICPMCQDELGEIPRYLAAPQSAIPPPNLLASIMAQLPATPALAAAAEQRTRIRHRVLWGGVAAFLSLLLVLGAYGVLVDSSGPAQVFGGIESAFGRGVLALTLVGKPMIAALGTLGWPLLLALVTLAGFGITAWRRLVLPPAALLVEVER